VRARARASQASKSRHGRATSIDAFHTEEFCHRLLCKEDRECCVDGNCEG